MSPQDIFGFLAMFDTVAHLGSMGLELKPDAHTMLFALSLPAIVLLAAMLSYSTESIASKTGSDPKNS